jgi:hypothetical protein
MKKALLIVIVFGLLFVSCKKKTVTPVPPAKITIVNKWRYKTTRALYMDSGGMILSEDDVDDYTDADYLRFNADGTGLSMIKGKEVDFTYSLKDSIETEYKLPRSAGDRPIIYTVRLTDTTLIRFGEEHMSGEFKTLHDESFVKF